MTNDTDTDTGNALARLQSLPKWVRNRLEVQDRRIADLTRRVAELSEGSARSDTAVNGQGVYPDRELGMSAIIRFRLPGGTIEAAIQGDYLNIRNTGAGGESQALVVQPQISNVVRIRPDRWW
jgi:hypothetical protein